MEKNRVNLCLPSLKFYQLSQSAGCWTWYCGIELASGVADFAKVGRLVDVCSMEMLKNKFFYATSTTTTTTTIYSTTNKLCI